jgi:hypothetical protein
MLELTRNYGRDKIEMTRNYGQKRAGTYDYE